MRSDTTGIDDRGIDRRLRWRFVFGVAIAALWMCGSLPRISAQGIQITDVTGNPSPDGNGNLSNFAAPAINNAGQLAFYSGLSSTAGGTADAIGVYRRTGSSLSLIARKGVSTINGTTINNFILTAPQINAAGTVNTIAVMPGAINLPFIGDGGPLTALIALGSASPTGNNTLVGTTFPVINDTGVAAYRGTYSGANTEQGHYTRAANGTITTRVLQQTTAPRGGTVSLLLNPTLNDANQIASLATIDLGGGMTTTSLLRVGASVQELAREDDLIADGVTTLETINSGGLINDAGQVAFSGSYSQPSVLRSGIFLADDSGIRLVGPGLLPGGTTATNNMRVAGINNAGKVAFSTEFNGGIDTPSGIYIADTTAPALVAFEDTATPEGNKFFRRFVNESITLNESGQLAFMADLSDTANGPQTGRGIYFYDPALGLRQVVRTGQALNGSTVSGLAFTGTVYSVTQSPATGFSGLNDSGKLGFAFTLANQQSGIATWSQPQLLGDYNGNGRVDAADYTIWRDKLGGTQALTNDDTAGVDLADYNRWKTNFGQTAGAASNTADGAPIPEPSTFVLLMLTAILLHSFRR